MLSSLANYLFGGNISGTQDSRESAKDDPLTSLPIMTRLRQVEIEGDDWILIDRAVEGTTTLEESWYVTPPACFTRAGPVNVETSPLEDLLIEHPSMSVYHATASPVAPDTPPPTPDTPEDRDVDVLLVPAGLVSTTSTPLDYSPGQNNLEESSHRTVIYDDRPATRVCNDKVRIANQLRSAQKVLEKRTTQSLKRGRLERSNKLRQVLSVKSKRPRRQDRLRVQNSGANNNRKC